MQIFEDFFLQNAFFFEIFVQTADFYDYLKSDCWHLSFVHEPQFDASVELLAFLSCIVGNGL